MDDWAKKRLAELEAAAPVKRKNKKDAFVKVPLWWIEAAAKATRTPQAFVCVWLLHLAWKAGRATFPLPNDRLVKRGVDRRMKRKVLAETGEGRADRRRPAPRQDPDRGAGRAQRWKPSWPNCGTGSIRAIDCGRCRCPTRAPP